MKKSKKIILTIFCFFIFSQAAQAVTYTYYVDQDNYYLCEDDDCQKTEVKEKEKIGDTQIKKGGKTYELTSKKTDWGEVEDTKIENICAKPELRKPLKFIGTIVAFAKTIIPIFIIALGIFDLAKAITSSKNDELKNAAKSIGVRLVAGICIFFVPSIVQFVLDWVNEWSDYKNTWCCCTECVLNSNCNTSSCNSTSCKIGG